MSEKVMEKFKLKVIKISIILVLFNNNNNIFY